MITNIYHYYFLIFIVIDACSHSLRFEAADTCLRKVIDACDDRVHICSYKHRYAATISLLLLHNKGRQFCCGKSTFICTQRNEHTDLFLATKLAAAKATFIVKFGIVIIVERSGRSLWTSLLQLQIKILSSQVYRFLLMLPLAQ